MKWTGIALVTQSVGKEDKLDTVLTIEGRHINYLAIATRWSTSIIKVSGRIHSNTFKEG